MEENKYLKWYNKVGYGSGDLAANMIYAILTSFVMIYLTDTVGLNAGIIGTLIMISKFFDGVTDIFFGGMIDKTHSKMGKARPWMLWSFLGNAVCLVAIFAIPSSFGNTAKYAYFFIFYTLLNAIFYTANNIAYASLTALITKNGNERVQIGSIRFMFSLATNLTVASITIGAVAAMGGGAKGWRTVALIYALIGLVVNTISVFSVKELPESELMEKNKSDAPTEKLSFLESLKLLITNKFYLIILAVYILMYVQTGVMAIGIYYMTYVMGDASLFGTFSIATMFPMIIGLAFTPFLVKKAKGMYKVNLGGFIVMLAMRVIFVPAGIAGNIPLMLITLFIAGIGSSPLTGTLNALIASASEYTYLKDGKRIDGLMYSCSSLGIKIGGGIGTAITGALLAAGGYVANAAVQPASCINVLNFMYLWLPLILCLVMCILLFMLKVEKVNAEWSK